MAKSDRLSVAEARQMAEEMLQPVLDRMNQMISDLREQKPTNMRAEDRDRAEVIIRQHIEAIKTEYQRQVEQFITACIAESN